MTTTGSAMSIDVGPYAFSVEDARKTLLHAFDLLDHHPTESRDAQIERRRRLEGVLRKFDPMKAEIDVVVERLRIVWPELLAARDDLVTAGVLPLRATGSIVAVNASDGGVPKRQIDRAEVGFGGLDGDRQATRAHHGRPWQALCLWSLEVIEALRSAGHPIHPGAAGENVTVSGLAWTDVRPGVQLQLGSALCQVSSYALPCSKNARWFSDGDIGRIHHERGTLSRVYATVLEPGTVATGDAAVLEPVSPGGGEFLR